MKKLLISILLIGAFSGCAFHYHNEKSIIGKGKDIKTKVGTIDGAQARFKSTLDFWFPWKVKRD